MKGEEPAGHGKKGVTKGCKGIKHKEKTGRPNDFGQGRRILRRDRNRRKGLQHKTKTSKKRGQGMRSEREDKGAKKKKRCWENDVRKKTLGCLMLSEPEQERRKTRGFSNAGC